MGGARPDERPPLFGREDVWNGSFYELAIELGTRSDTRLAAASTTLWHCEALDGPYREGERTMAKVKHLRTADCVVAGTRRHKDGKGVGSLLLGLFDDEGALRHVGVASSFAA